MTYLLPPGEPNGDSVLVISAIDIISLPLPLLALTITISLGISNGLRRKTLLLLDSSSLLLATGDEGEDVAANADIEDLRCQG